MAKLKDGSQVFGSLRVNGTFLDSSGDAGTSGQVLSSTGTGTNWVASGGGGGATVKFYCAAGPSANLTLTGTLQTVVLNTEVEDSGVGTADFTLTSGVVTIANAGVYVVSYTVLTDMPSGTSARSESEAFLRINGSNELANSQVIMYNRDVTEGAASGSKTILYNATANDTIQIVAARRAGTADGIAVLASQSVLTLYKVS